MRRLLLISLLLTAASFAQITQIDVQQAHGNGSNPVSFPALNTTSATTILGCFSAYEGYPLVTDSCGNLWQHGNIWNSDTGIWFVSSPVSCPSDVVKLSNADIPSGIVYSFSGTTQSYPYATAVGTSGSGSPLQMGSLTPAESGDMIFSCVGGVLDQTITPTIDSSFVSPTYNSGSTNNTMASYLVTSSGSAVNPTWTITGSSSTAWSGSQAVIKQVTSTPPSGSGTTLYNYLGTGARANPTTTGYPLLTPVYWPGQIVTDSNGNVAVAVVESNVIVGCNNQSTQQTLWNVIIPAGECALIAGTGTNGCSGYGGQGVSAKLAHPVGLAIDSSNNLYIADQQCHAVEELAITGVFSIIAGQGSGGVVAQGCGSYALSGHTYGVAGTSALLRCPQGVAVDGSGNVIISDSGNQQVAVVNQQGTTQNLFGVSTPAGYIEAILGTGTQSCSTSSAAGTSFNINNPLGASVNGSGTYCAAVYGCNDIICLTSGGTASVYAGNGTSGCTSGVTAANAEYIHPYDFKFDSSGNGYVANTGCSTIDEVNHSTTNDTVVAGSNTLYGNGGGYIGIGGYANIGAIYYPVGLAVVSSTDFYVSNLLDNRVMLVETAPITTYTLTITGSGTGTGTVASNDSVINCTITAGSTSGSCTDTVGSGTVLTITATEPAGNLFGGYTGAGCSTSPCSITMSASHSVAAAFNLVVPTLSMSGHIVMSGTVPIN